MNPNELITTVASFFPWGFIKIAILTMVAMYIVFAAVIVRQGQLMARVVEVPSSPLLKLVSLIHFLASLVVFVLALVLL